MTPPDLNTPLPPAPSPTDLVEVRVRSGSGRVLHRHLTDAKKWALPGGSLTTGEAPEAAATRALFETTGYEIPMEALVHEGTREDGGVRHHVFSVSAGKGRQKGKASSPTLWMK
jgi:ADP-ribose pyrophosphatase YjhB (NUDIX family)